MRAGLAAYRRAQRRLRGRALAAWVAGAALAAVLTACGPASSAVSGSSGRSTGSASNSVTYAMQPGGFANYPFPFFAGKNYIGDDTVYNVNDFQYQLYRPLYWFGTGTTPYLNPAESLAEKPLYSNHHVTIRLKQNYKWSNGEPVEASNVVFFMNMMKALGKNWIFWSQTGLPTDVTNVRAASKFVVTFDITTRQFSQSWFTNNMLSEITPMPAYWDRTKNGPSHCSTTVSDCLAVYNYLNSQAIKPTTSFATSPIWSIVDGPWKIQSLDSQGKLVLTYNTQYGGPVSPHHITTFTELPFTSEQAEYNVLQDPTSSQTIDVGYLPTVDAPVPPAGQLVGANPSSLSNYQLSVLYVWQMTYFPYNFNNNTGQAPIFKQLYFRQAFQALVDQEGVIDGPLHGYGKATTGPVSTYPLTKYLAPQLAGHRDPWTLNIPRVQKTLQAHGWTVNPNGIDTCAKGGAGPGHCGAGIAAGTPLKFTLQYALGRDWMESAVRELASNASLAGIQVRLDGKSFGDVVNSAFGLNGQGWQMAFWGSWTYAPDYLPTGDTLFASAAANNAGAYNDPHNDQLITASLDARSPSEFDTAMYAWQNYLAGQLPVVYEPDAPTLIETIKGLDIGPQNSALDITPEMWSYRQ
ncbi:MAG TPA: ABC transporter substrate-binding protein [Streptosporangiaceae bacterium]|nr:ABC transporter substrate-binding protein [Streptosporangiaceae bacterium]